MFKLNKKAVSSMLVTFLLTSSIFGNDVTAQALAMKAENSTAVKVETEQVAANNYGLVGVKEGNILHAWDWKFTDVTKNIQTIAESGYSIVQVSPCQVCEDTTTNNDWWKLYQPYDYAFGNSLGSEAEFKEMCSTAEEYGISIIVDVVANHMAGTGEGNCGTIKPEVNSWWTSDKFHNTGIKFTGDYDNDREKMVTSNIGMPDVNTSREDVQQRMVAYLEKMLDMGADGFRYDAAKHIGTTSDTGASNDTFWKTISAAVSAKRPDALVYGEILNSMPVSEEYYVKDGIKVTESQKGWDMKDLVQGGASKVTQKTAFTYTRTTSASNLITWVENHDTYLNYWGSTGLTGHANYMSDEQIILAWSTVAARADAQALFFARPDGCSSPADTSNPDASNTIAGSLGISTKNTIWKDARVAAVNKFKNAMVGTDEKTSTQGGVAVIVRGNKGVVATNFGSDSASFSASGLTGLADGTYTDASGQNGSFTVSGGQVSGTIKGNSFVVLYDEEQVLIPTDAPTSTPTGTPSTDTKITFSTDSSSFEKAFDVTINVENTEYAYYSYDGSDWTEIKDGKATVTIGADATNNGDAYGLYVHVKGLDGKLYDESKIYTYSKKIPVSGDYTLKLRVAKSEFATAPYVYFYDPNGTGDATDVGPEWPGTKMTEEGDYWVFTSKTIETGYAIFNDGKDWQDPAKDEGNYKVSGCMEYSKSAGKVTAFTETTEEPSGSAKPANTPAAYVDQTSSPEPPVTDIPTPCTSGSPQISTSLEDGSSFYDETAEVELSFANTVEASYTVDNGPVQKIAIDESNKTAKATIGLGKIADTDVTLKVTATSKEGLKTEKTYTYHKVFVKKASVASTMSTFASKVMEKITEEAGTVNAGLSGAPTSSYYATNPSGNKGSKKTITKASDFTEDMIIAQGVANDDARTFKGMHEYPVLDLYAMYGAWDDNNIYIGIQYVNTADINASDQQDAKTDRAKPSQAQIPQAIYFDLGSGDYTDGSTSDGAGTTVWNLHTTFEGSAKVDAALVYAASLEKYANLGFYKSVGGAFDYDTGVFTQGSGCVTLASTGIKQTFEDTFIGTEMWGIKGNGNTGYKPEDLNSDSSNWVDFLKEGHNTSLDTFMTFTIPYEFLGITKEDVETKGIGIMQSSTFGASGIETLPMDMTMLDNATEEYSYGDNTSHEKEDDDVVTVALARLGNGDVPTPAPGTPAPAPGTPAPAPGTPSPAPETPSPAPETSSPAPETSAPDDTAYCVNFGADKSAPQYDTTELTLSAVVYNGTAPYTYAFSVDGQEVQNSAEASYKWTGTEGTHTIKVVVTDAEGKTIASEKQYIITKNGSEIPTTTAPNPIDTETPSAAPTEAVPTEAVPTDTAPTTGVPTAPTTEVPTVPPTEGPTAPATEIPNLDLPTITPGNGTTEGTKKEGLAIQTFLTDPLSTQELGKTVTLKTEITGGTGNIKYTYVVANKDNADDIDVVAYDVAEATVTWTPKAVGEFIVYVMVSDDNEDGDYAALNYTITVAPTTPATVKPTATPKALKVKTLKVTTKKKNRVVKKKIKVKATVSNKQGTVKYKFRIKKKGAKKKTVVRKYKAKKTATFKVKKAGTYFVYVSVKDKRNVVKTKRIKITVKKK